MAEDDGVLHFVLSFIRGEGEKEFFNIKTKYLCHGPERVNFTSK
jgi:hypothetical protein